MKILLVIAYLSSKGIPRIEVHTMSEMVECQRKAVQVVQNIKTGSGRAWCKKVVAFQD